MAARRIAYSRRCPLASASTAAVPGKEKHKTKELRKVNTGVSHTTKHARPVTSLSFGKPEDSYVVQYAGPRWRNNELMRLTRQTRPRPFGPGGPSKTPAVQRCNAAGTMGPWRGGGGAPCAGNRPTRGVCVSKYFALSHQLYRYKFKSQSKSTILNKIPVTLLAAAPRPVDIFSFVRICLGNATRVR